MSREVTTQVISPFLVLAKPTGPICNLDCAYCYYLSKEMLYPGGQFRMTEDVLEAYLKQLLYAQRHLPEVSVAWQGGEPTLRGLDFYRRSVELIEELKQSNQEVVYSIQTNGTRIDDRWAAFFKKHNFLVGISIDGPTSMHDAYRVNRRGEGTFDRVLAGYEYLRAHGVGVNVLCTVHTANQEHPLEIYRFFRDELEAKFIQFIPIVERSTEAFLPLSNLRWSMRAGKERVVYHQEGTLVTDRSVDPQAFGRFLTEIFDEWVRHDVGTVFVQHFDVALASWYNGQPGLCNFAETCGRAVAMEHNGDVYACDHYVESDYRLGNIMETPLPDLLESPNRRAFGKAKRDSLPAWCSNCDVRFACNGGCPKNRFTLTPDGEEGLNYLCPAYKTFFNHIRRPMEIMSDLLHRGRAPSEIMTLMTEEDDRRYRQVGRNDPCPCGSGRKFKLCHLEDQQSGTTSHLDNRTP